MISQEVLQLAVTVLAVLATTLWALKKAVTAHAKSAYEKILEDSPSQCDIDTFCTPENPPSYLKVWAVHKLRVGSRKPDATKEIALQCVPSQHVEGLWVAHAASDEDISKQDDATPLQDLLPRLTKSGVPDKREKPTVVVATIRMGFGHHRIAYSACSWALSQGYTTIFHDMLNVKSEERELIGSADTIYSRMSRLSTEIGGPIEYLWGQAMKQGDSDGLRIAALEATYLMPLLKAYPRNTPLITTHQLVALTAAAAGFTNVCNLVVDNFPQWFLVVPRTLNLTQGPVNYQSFLKMGVPPHQLKLAGHWCPTGLVDNIDTDCKARIARANAGNKACRLLIPVGGAGAQKTFINSFLKNIQDLVKNGQVQLFLNAGDHTHMKTAFEEVLNECHLDYDVVNTTDGVHDFQKNLLNQENEPTKAVTLFAFDEYFPAVATTDILGRVADVLVCKPSELAFYALPKLHIRRVGDHEADSARRAAEVGDGTLEAREVHDARKFMDLFLKSPDFLVHMNEQVMQANTIGLYNGCANAVNWAIEGKPNESFHGK